MKRYFFFIKIASFGGIFGTLDKGLDIDMSNDAKIEKIVVNSIDNIKVSSLSGKNLKTIDIVNSNVTVYDLCMFISPRKLQNLNLFHVSSSTLMVHSIFTDLSQSCGSENAEESSRKLKVVNMVANYLGIVRIKNLQFETILKTFFVISGHDS